MKNKILYIISVLVILVYSCELPDNVDPKNPVSVQAESVFTSALVALDSLIGSINQNVNISRLLVQYQSQVQYIDESRYNFQDRQIPDLYSAILYRDVLMNLKDSRTKIEGIDIPTVAGTKQKKNKLAIIEVCSVYAYQMLVDAFGNVPYSQSLMGAANSRAAYDDAATIYNDLVLRLNAAIADLDGAYQGFGLADVLYDGNVSLWKKFACSLKLRIAMRLSDVPGSNSGTLISEAVASGVFTNQSESAILVWPGLDPLVSSYYSEYVLRGRFDYTPSNTLVDMMNSLNDPRRHVWFTQVEGEYIGITYGLTESSDYDSYSHFAESIRLNPTYPVIMSDYVEVEFLLAEAAERGLGGVTNAETHYNNAIRASMAYWGVSDADASVYLAQPSVAYSTAGASFKEKIGNQKWLGLFDRGVEGWAEWRRLDFPILNVPEDMTYSDIPVRMPYPYNEDEMNSVSYQAAVNAMGGDLPTIKLFWDKF
ncbi:MAG TPA: SusD/RagB family nutrient-binding outer membrane lipoprotein [Bacteroidales bacterium]|nr:SusD/RagB family nutrient-binding outer membrane lipoprotein [Bacteroidales bacterium]